MDCRQVGQYILALCAQWGAERGAERTGLRTADGALKATLRGEELDASVRAKFEPVTLPGGTFLRNRRMSLEIADSLTEWEAKVKGGVRTAERTAEQDADRTAMRTATTLTTTSTSVQPEAQPEQTSTDIAPSAPVVSEADQVTKLYVMVLDAVFGRRTRVIADDVRAAVRKRLKACKREQIISTPILVKAQGSWTLPQKPSPIHFLRDGEHGKQLNGTSYGARNWIGRATENVDGTFLDAALTSIAQQAGVYDWLIACGCRTQELKLEP